MRAITPRQKQVMALLAKGYDTKQIADRLHISEDIVRRHCFSIRCRLGILTAPASRLQEIAREQVAVHAN